jgi:hypothetical protein
VSTLITVGASLPTCSTRPGWSSGIIGLCHPTPTPWPFPITFAIGITRIPDMAVMSLTILPPARRPLQPLCPSQVAYPYDTASTHNQQLPHNPHNRYNPTIPYPYDNQHLWLFECNRYNHYNPTYPGGETGGAGCPGGFGCDDDEECNGCSDSTPYPDRTTSPARVGSKWLYRPENRNFPQHNPQSRNRITRRTGGAGRPGGLDCEGPPAARDRPTTGVLGCEGHPSQRWAKSLRRNGLQRKMPPPHLPPHPKMAICVSPYVPRTYKMG